MKARHKILIVLTGLLMAGALFITSCQGATTTSTDTPDLTPEPTPASTPSGSASPPLSSSAGDVTRGEVIFQQTAGGIGCAACHAKDAMGNIGPEIIGKAADEISYALRTVEEMEFLKITEQEIDDLAAYLEYLKSQQMP